MPESIILVNNSRETFTSDRSGAIATCLWELCRAAERGDFRPHVITRGGDGDPYDWSATTWLSRPGSEPVGIRRRVARLRRRLAGWARPDQSAYAKQVATVIRQREPEVVVINNDPEVAVYLRRAFPRLRIVHWFHNLEVAGDRFRRRIVLDDGIELVAVSRYLSRAVESVYGMAPFRVSTALNGVDADRIRPHATDHAVPTIGFIGRVAVEKGVDVLLDACAVLASGGARFAVELVGNTNWGFSDGGPYARTVGRGVARLRELGIDVSERGHVPRESIPAAIARFDIQAVPSRWDDPMPLTVLEGLAAGLPVVASSSGGIPEVLWGAGCLVPRDDADALAQTLGRLVGDADERRRLGTAARARAEALTWDSTWATLLAARTS